MIARVIWFKARASCADNLCSYYFTINFETSVEFKNPTVNDGRYTISENDRYILEKEIVKRITGTCICGKPLERIFIIR